MKDKLFCVLRIFSIFHLYVLHFLHLQNGAMPRGTRIPGIDTMEAGGDGVWLVARSLEYPMFLPHSDIDLLLGHVCCVKQIENKSPSDLSVLFYQSLSPIPCSDMEHLQW